MGDLDQARDQFVSGESVLRSFAEAAAVSEPGSRSLLAKFGLGAEHVLRPAATLSPGSGRGLVTHDRRLFESVRVTHVVDLGQKPPRLRRSDAASSRG